MIDIDELERLSNAVTPGPWMTHINAIVTAKPTPYAMAKLHLLAACVGRNALEQRSLTEFITFVRNAMPAIIAELRTARACVESLRLLRDNKLINSTSEAARHVGAYDEACSNGTRDGSVDIERATIALGLGSREMNYEYRVSPQLVDAIDGGDPSKSKGIDMIDLESLPTAYELAQLAEFLDEDNLATYAGFVRKIAPLIREVRSAREVVKCAENAARFFSDDYQAYIGPLHDALSAYDEATKVKP